MSPLGARSGSVDALKWTASSQGTRSTASRRGGPRPSSRPETLPRPRRLARTRAPIVSTSRLRRRRRIAQPRRRDDVQSPPLRPREGRLDRRQRFVTAILLGRHRFQRAARRVCGPVSAVHFLSPRRLFGIGYGGLAGRRARLAHGPRHEFDWVSPAAGSQQADLAPVRYRDP